jgi:hypothetical protein
VVTIGKRIVRDRSMAKAVGRNNQWALRPNIRRNTASPIDALQITPYGFLKEDLLLGFRKPVWGNITFSKR